MSNKSLVILFDDGAQYNVGITGIYTKPTREDESPTTKGDSLQTEVGIESIKKAGLAQNGEAGGKIARGMHLQSKYTALDLTRAFQVNNGTLVVSADIHGRYRPREMVIEPEHNDMSWLPIQGK